MELFNLVILCGLIGLILLAWRQSDHLNDRRTEKRLAGEQPAQPSYFDPQMVAHLPAPARRYFLYTIEPGAPLFTVARLTMTGKFGMGNREKPAYLDMNAIQTLAAPTGFVWKMRARRGLLWLSGSDSDRWTRFWLMGLLPVARMGGNSDHTRSAFGRYIAESVFWSPAAVLPRPGIVWEAVDDNRARLTVMHQGLSQSIELTVAEDGQPTQVQFDRWSNANPEKTFRLQPFGGFLSDFQSFHGYHLPTHVEAGNHFGTDDYFPFFLVDVTAVDFPH